MNTFKKYRWTLPGTAIAILGLCALPANAALVTTNLFVQLNGDSTNNFISSGAGSGAVQVWKDLAEVGNDASQQDFGQTTPERQPALLPNTPVPNSASTGITYHVLDFDRSTSTSNSASSSTNSDVLRGKSSGSARPTNYGDPMTLGADAAYDLSSLSTGVSWFMVFRSTDNSTINNNNSRPPGNGSSGTSRWGQQTLIDVQYTNSATDWGIFAIDGVDADTQVNMLNHVRNKVNGETDNPAQGTTNGNMLANTWYMAANSYDPVNGVFRTVVTTPDGFGGTTILLSLITDTDIDPNLLNPNVMGDGTLGPQAAIALGHFAGSADTSTNAWSFDGLMAEVLIYDTALGSADFNSVVGYLNDKYFNAIPESRFGLLGVALLCGVFVTGLKLHRAWRGGQTQA